MNITCCPHCNHDHHWTWEEAFDKFGFGDGDGLVMTEHVAETIRAAGCTVTTVAWGMHNVVIQSIKRNEVELIPEAINLGYDDPRSYLPADIIALLDDKLSDEQVEP